MMKSFAFTFFLMLPFVLPAQDVCLTEEEKKLYDLMVQYRKSKKLKSIPISAKLTRVAQTHVRDLSENYIYEEGNRCNPHSWSAKGKWSACCYTPDHKEAKCMWSKPKEIAGYEGNGYEIAYFSSAGANATEGLDGWKKSPGHNPVIINLGSWSKIEWKAIGVGIYKEYGVVWFGEEEDLEKVNICSPDEVSNPIIPNPIARHEEVIKMEMAGGVFYIPCRVNGLDLKFILDTGASKVSLSLTEAIFMLKNNYLKAEDIRGIEKYRIANGQIKDGTQVLLREIRIGNRVIKDVEASISHSIEAPLLLGQSLLEKLGGIRIDYNANTLTIKN